MSRKNNITKKMLKYLMYLKSKYFNLSIPYQIVIVLCLCGIFCQFIPWIIDNDNALSWNAFNPIVGNVGYLLCIIYTLLIFVMLSNSIKDNIKLYMDISFKNYFLVISSGFVSMFFGIIVVSFVKGLSTIGQNFQAGKGMILSMVIGVFIIIFGFVIRKSYKNNNSEIILEQLNQNRGKTKEKDNMSLPI